MADDDDPAITKVRTLWAERQAEGWTQQKLGEAMGYKPDTARKSVSQFLKSRDPHISVLRRFAGAIGISTASLVRE